MERTVKRKYSDAARIKRRLQDSYVDGLTDDEQAVEARDWHDAYTPPIETHWPPIDLNDELIPF
jgi:hypothetical protein